MAELFFFVRLGVLNDSKVSKVMISCCVLHSFSQPCAEAHFILGGKPLPDTKQKSLNLSQQVLKHRH